VAAQQRELTAGPSGGPGRIFLLSPADSSGKRARLLEDSDIDLAQRLRARSGAPLGEVFSFVSSLYFRGKLADLRRFAGVPIDPDEGRYRRPLLRDLAALAAASPSAEVVLLGSIASAKYVDLLKSVLAGRLLFPVEFVGRGDMSRGGLMLRCVASAEELRYLPIDGAVRRGPRPPRLRPLV
jgi:hypothetical protein